jgi:hypothetical protein
MGMTPDQRKARAYAAIALLDDDTITQGWIEIENDLRAEWEKSILPRKRDRIWSELKHLKALRHRLASYASHAPRD